MKDLLTLAEYALRLPGIPPNTSFAGAFEIPCPATGSRLRVVASAVLDWDHVCASLPKRCPNWPEMSRVKSLFFHDHECAMQLHVPAADHVNNHPFCLHLFRPHRLEIPRPPVEFVGMPGMTPEQVKGMGKGELLAHIDAAASRITGIPAAPAAGRPR